MTTVKDYLEDALMEIGAYAPGASLEASQYAHALRELNRMIQAWNAEELMVYTVDRQTFTITSGKQFYTIGIGGDFNVPRPVVINMASVLYGDTHPTEIRMSILTDEQWRDVTLKDTGSSFPTMMWPNNNYPLNTLAMWPIPNGTYTIVLYTWGQAAEFSDPSDSVVFPPAYGEAIVKNLALRLSATYAIQPSPLTLQFARESKARIKEINFDPMYRTVEKTFRGPRNNIGTRSRGYVLE